MEEPELQKINEPVISYTEVWSPITNSVNPNLIMATVGSHTAMIPNDSENRDWIKYQDWLKLGNEPKPAQKQTLAQPYDLASEIQALKARIAVLESE